MWCKEKIVKRLPPIFFCSSFPHSSHSFLGHYCAFFFTPHPFPAHTNSISMAEDKDIERVLSRIKLVGAKTKEGCFSTTYKKLYSDERISDRFDVAYLGTLLRAAKRQKYLHYAGAALMQGASDSLEIVVYPDELRGVGIAEIESRNKAPEPSNKVEKVGHAGAVGKIGAKFQRQEERAQAAAEQETTKKPLKTYEKKNSNAFCLHAVLLETEYDYYRH